MIFTYIHPTGKNKEWDSINPNFLFGKKTNYERVKVFCEEFSDIIEYRDSNTSHSDMFYIYENIEKHQLKDKDIVVLTYDNVISTNWQLFYHHFGEVLNQAYNGKVAVASSFMKSFCESDVSWGMESHYSAGYPSDRPNSILNSRKHSQLNYKQFNGFVATTVENIKNCLKKHNPKYWDSLLDGDMETVDYLNFEQAICENSLHTMCVNTYGFVKKLNYPYTLIEWMNHLDTTIFSMGEYHIEYMEPILGETIFLDSNCYYYIYEPGEDASFFSANNETKHINKKCYVLKVRLK